MFLLALLLGLGLLDLFLHDLNDKRKALTPRAHCQLGARLPGILLGALGAPNHRPFFVILGLLLGPRRIWLGFGFVLFGLGVHDIFNDGLGIYL